MKMITNKCSGYEEYRDFIFLSPKPEVIRSNSELKHYEDYFGNVLDADSPASIRFKGRNAHVHIGKNVKIPDKLIIDIRENSLLYIGYDTIFQNISIKMSIGTEFVIGKKVFVSGLNIFINDFSAVEVGNECSLQTGKLRTGRNKKIVIGKDCMFSWDIVFLPHDGHLIWDLKEGRFTNNTTGERELSIVIGDHCWIGGETVIMPNTSIGSGSICGYRCMAKGKYPNNCIIVGQPGRVVKKDIAWMRRNVSYDDKDIMLIDEQYRKFTEEDIL